MNNKTILGEHSNSTGANILGILVVLIALLLGIKSIMTVLGMI